MNFDVFGVLDWSIPELNCAEKLYENCKRLVHVGFSPTQEGWPLIYAES